LGSEVTIGGCPGHGLEIRVLAMRRRRSPAVRASRKRLLLDGPRSCGSAPTSATREYQRDSSSKRAWTSAVRGFRIPEIKHSRDPALDEGSLHIS